MPAAGVPSKDGLRLLREARIFFFYPFLWAHFDIQIVVCLYLELGAVVEVLAIYIIYITEVWTIFFNNH